MAAPRRSAKASADAPSAEPEPLEDEQEHKDPDGEQPAKANGPTVMERAYMDALQRERAGYERRGLTNRVAQVDAELKRFER